MSRSNSGRLHPTVNVENYQPLTSKDCLVFDASFESGNLGNVEYVSEHEYNLEIKQDSNNNKFRLWYYFSVTNFTPKSTVLFNITNFSKSKSLYRTGQSPLVCTEENRNRWYRLPPNTCWYYRPKASDKACYQLSFAFKFPEKSVTGKVYFAYCFPYTYSRLQQYLQMLDCDRRYAQTYERELVAMSAEHRRVDLLTITSATNMQRLLESKTTDLMQSPTQSPKTKASSTSSSSSKASSSSKNSKKQESSYLPVVFISARVHPGETPSSYAMEAIIDFLLSTHGRNLRKIAVFKIVPMINPDGVAVGNYRCSTLGYDLNRCYTDPSAWAMAEIYGIKDVLEQFLDKDGNGRKITPKAELYIDIHGHSALTNSFMYGNFFEDNAERCTAQHILPNFMDKISQDFSIRNTNYNADKAKEGTARRTLESTAHLYAYTLEISMSHFYGKFNTNAVFYDEAKYASIGTNLMRSIEHYFTTRRKGRKTLSNSVLGPNAHMVM